MSRKISAGTCNHGTFNFTVNLYSDAHFELQQFILKIYTVAPMWLSGFMFELTNSSIRVPNKIAGESFNGHLKNKAKTEVSKSAVP